MKAGKISIALAFAIFFFYRFVLWWLHPLRSWADQSVYLAMSQLLLMGKVPYLDFFDFNPPLIMYLNIFPWLIAAVFNWPITFAFIVAIYALAAASLWLCWLIFDHNSERPEYKYRWYILFLMLAFTQAQQPDFGQREHLFILLFFPYVLLRCFAYSGGSAPRSLALMTGALAGLGVCIKPHFLEVLVVFELTWQLTHRQWKILLNWECRALFAAIVLYIAHFLFLPGAALDVLFNQALPIYSSGVASFASSIICGLTLDAAFFMPIYFMVVLLILSTAMARLNSWIVPLTSLVLISFVIYLQSGTVWTYRMLPLQAFSDLLFGLQAGILIEILLQRPAASKVAGLVRKLAPFALLIACTAYGISEARAYYADIKGLNKFPLSTIGYNGTNPTNDLDAVFFTLLKHTNKDDRVLLMGPAVLPGYPAVLQAGRLPGSRYLHGMVLPMLHYCIQNFPGKKYEDLEKTVVQNYGQDILKNKPRLVFISQEFIRPQIDKYEFVPTYLQDYEVLGNLHQFKYDVFKLKDKSLPAGKWPLQRRRELVLKIMSDQLTVDQAASQSGISKGQIEDWLRRAEDALDAAMTDNPGGGESELRSMVLDNMDKSNKLKDEIVRLRAQLDALKTKDKSR